MEELGRNSRAPVLLGTVQFGTTHKLTLHLQIARKGVIYKEVCLGKLPRHNSLDKRLKTGMNSPAARRTTTSRKYCRAPGRRMGVWGGGRGGSLLASKRCHTKEDGGRTDVLRLCHTSGPESLVKVSEIKWTLYWLKFPITWCSLPGRLLCPRLTCFWFNFRQMIKTKCVKAASRARPAIAQLLPACFLSSPGSSAGLWSGKGKAEVAQRQLCLHVNPEEIGPDPWGFIIVFKYRLPAIFL